MCRLHSLWLPGGGRLQPRCGAQHCSLAPRPGSPSVLSNPVRATPEAASPGCALGGRSPWRMSWSRWRMSWSCGYVDPQLGGGAGPGRAECSGRRKGRAGCRPLSGLHLLPDPSPEPAASGAFLESLWDGVPFASSSPPFRSSLQCGLCGGRGTRVAAGQGRAGKCPLCWLKLLFLAP